MGQYVVSGSKVPFDDVWIIDDERQRAETVFFTQVSNLARLLFVIRHSHSQMEKELEVDAKMEDQEEVEASELVVEMDEVEDEMIISLAYVCSDPAELEDDRAAQSEVAESESESKAEAPAAEETEETTIEDEIVMPAMDWSEYNKLAMRMAAESQRDLPPSCDCVWKKTKFSKFCLPKRCRKLSSATRSQPCFPPPFGLFVQGQVRKIHKSKLFQLRQDLDYLPEVRDQAYWNKNPGQWWGDGEPPKWLKEKWAKAGVSSVGGA